DEALAVRRPQLEVLVALAGEGGRSRLDAVEARGEGLGLRTGKPGPFRDVHDRNPPVRGSRPAVGQLYRRRAGPQSAAGRPSRRGKPLEAVLREGKMSRWN